MVRSPLTGYLENAEESALPAICKEKLKQVLPVSLGNSISRARKHLSTKSCACFYGGKIMRVHNRYKVCTSMASTCLGYPLNAIDSKRLDFNQAEWSVADCQLPWWREQVRSINGIDINF